MKTIILFLNLIVLSIPGFSQLTYEGSVNSKYKTIQLDDGSIKYFDFNSTNNELNFNNIDGSPWKRIKISLKRNEYFDEILLVSQYTINPDSSIEVAYTTTTFVSQPPNHENPEAGGNRIDYTLNIINEKGISLLSIPNSHALKLSSTNGKNKLLIYTGTEHSFRSDGEILVYTLPENK